MFEGFAAVWSPVCLSRDLRGDGPSSVRFAGEKIVFFRDASGVARALIDRCPHRGVQLSLGNRTADGCIACPFHGWEFAGDGAVKHVPFNPDAKTERLGATALPCREIAGILWVYTAAMDSDAPPPEPTLPESLTREGVTRCSLSLEWKAHWTRAMENMLDSPHVPFVHRTTIGRFMQDKIKRDSRMDMNWEETDYGGESSFVMDGNAGGGKLRFYKPNIMELHIDPPNKFFRIISVCVPIDREHVRMLIVGSRSFARSRLLNPFFARSNRVIAEQDRAIVESSSPTEVPPAKDERSVRTDSVTLAFRKYYFDTLRPSSAHDPNGPRALPVVT